MFGYARISILPVSRCRTLSNVSTDGRRSTHLDAQAGAAAPGSCYKHHRWPTWCQLAIAFADMHDEPELESSRRYVYESHISEQKLERPHPHSHHAHHPRPVPDFRFESSYLRSVAPYVHVERTIAAVVAHDEKGKGRVQEGEEEGAGDVVVSSASTEVVRVDWGRVGWITTRDQVLIPLIQGALWGLLGDYLRPLGAAAGARFRRWWAAGSGRPDGPQYEGHGVGWLRGWIASFTSVVHAPGVGVAKGGVPH